MGGEDFAALRLYVISEEGVSFFSPFFSVFREGGAELGATQGDLLFFVPHISAKPVYFSPLLPGRREEMRSKRRSR